MWPVWVLFFLLTPILLFILFSSLPSFFKSLKAFKNVSVFSVLKFNSEGSFFGFLFIQGAEYLVCPFSLETLFSFGTFSWVRLLVISSNFSFLSQIPFIEIIDLLDQSSNFLIFSFLFSIFFFLLYCCWVFIYYHIFNFQELLSLVLLNSIYPVLVAIILSLSLV